MRNKTKLISGVALLAILVATGSMVYINKQSDLTEPSKVAYTKVFNVSANMVQYDTAKVLDEGAELIVIGSATEDFMDREHEVTTYEDGYLQSFSTNTNIKIDKVIKSPSDFPTDQKELTIIEPVSVDDGEKLTYENYIELQKNEQSIIFLKKNSFGNYGVINANRGKISLTDPDPQIELQSFTAPELSRYDQFRNEVLEYYHLDK